MPKTPLIPLLSGLAAAAIWDGIYVASKWCWVF
jgi:hypothetical protein